MKHFPFLFVVALILSSCLNGSADYTPEFRFSYFTTQTGDTLAVRYDEAQELNYLDTIHLGDTVNFTVLFDAYGNTLTAAKYAWDSDMAKLEVTFDSTLVKLLATGSDTAKGNLLFSEAQDLRAVVLPMHYVPLKQGSTNMRFQIESNSKFSPNNLSLTFPVRE